MSLPMKRLHFSSCDTLQIKPLKKFAKHFDTFNYYWFRMSVLYSCTSGTRCLLKWLFCKPLHASWVSFTDDEFNVLVTVE